MSRQAESPPASSSSRSRDEHRRARASPSDPDAGRPVMPRLASAAEHSASQRVFDPASLSALDEPVRRYLNHALAPGAVVASGRRLSMAGRIKVGCWLAFDAEQEMSRDGARRRPTERSRSHGASRPPTNPPTRRQSPRSSPATSWSSPASTPSRPMPRCGKGLVSSGPRPAVVVVARAVRTAPADSLRAQRLPNADAAGRETRGWLPRP
jgi:hypothetical protein